MYYRSESNFVEAEKENYKTDIIDSNFNVVLEDIIISEVNNEIGYLRIGTAIGEYFSGLSNKNWAILVGFVLGAFAIIAEPALHVLKKQVEDVTTGTIRQSVIVVTISIGVALSVMVAVIRAIYSFNVLYMLIPLYSLSIILAFINPKLITAIAFDSGGVATGSMAVSFILPMVSGLAESGNGFGTIALIACFPVVTMQILGLIYKIKVSKNNKLKLNEKLKNNYIVEFDYERHYLEPLVVTRDEVIEFEYTKKKKGGKVRETHKRR